MLGGYDWDFMTKEPDPASHSEILGNWWHETDIAIYLNNPKPDQAINHSLRYLLHS